MKQSIFLLILFSICLSSCCPYCAESYSHGLVYIELYDENSGQLIVDNVDVEDFELESREGNESKLEGSNYIDKHMNLSVAREHGMSDVLTLKWNECSCTIAEMAIEYEIYGDPSCCDYRSVTIKDLKSNCTDPDLVIVESGGTFTRIKIMVDI